jgi:ubiquinone/menaquinone biosynthesis C-methylase UbiE
MQKHLNTLSPDVKIFIGEFKDTLLCLNSKQELALEIEDETVDHIITQYLFSLYEKPQIALEELHRVLKPGQAVLMLEYTSDKSPFQIYQKELFSTNDVDLPPIFQRILSPSKPLTKENILSTIKKTSFEVIEVVDVPNLPRFLLQKAD